MTLRSAGLSTRICRRICRLRNLRADSSWRELRNFIIDTTPNGLVLTGLVVANESTVGRLPLFKLGLPADLAVPLQVHRFLKSLTLPGVTLTLTEEAATALNGAFKVTAFAEDFLIGTASVQAYGLRN